MLTLTRRLGERIAIGDDVEITIVDIGRGKVRIGIRAPRERAILRAEVLERIVEENRLAASALSPDAPSGGDVIVFAHGLPGLREHVRFGLAEVPGHPAVRALVSELDPFVRLLLIDAEVVDREYPVADAKRRANLGDEEVAVALVLTLPSEGAPSANFLAPIVIGLSTMRAEQVILDGSGLPARQELSTGDAAMTG